MKSPGLAGDPLMLSPGRVRVESLGRRLWERAERCYVVVVILIVSGAFLPYLYGSGLVPARDSDPVGRLVRVSLLLLVLAFALTRPRTFIRAANTQKLSLLLPLVAVVSAKDSLLPPHTIATGLHFVTITLFGLYLGTRFTWHELLRLIGWTLGIGVVASLLLLIVAPDQAYLPDQGGVRGIYSHKNSLGMHMALAAFTLGILARGATRWRWALWGLVGLAFLLLLASSSSTALVVLAGVSGLMPLYHLLRSQRGLRVPMAILGILVAAGALGILVYERAPIVALLGRDVTLTGRTDLWEGLVNLAMRRPWLGYGYGGLWGLCPERHFIEVDCGGPHNGLLGLWLDVGLLGLAAFLLAFGSAVRTMLAHSQATRTAPDLWPILFMNFLVLNNITEDTILRALGLWIIFVATLGSLRYTSHPHRPQPQGSAVDPRHARAPHVHGASLGVRGALRRSNGRS